MRRHNIPHWLWVPAVLVLLTLHPALAAAGPQPRARAQALAPVAAPSATPLASSPGAAEEETVSPRPDGVVTALERDGWYSCLHLGLVAAPLLGCWVLPGSVVLLLTGGTAAMVAVVFPPAGLVAWAVPGCSALGNAPGCLLPLLTGATCGGAVAQLFGPRRGAWLPSVLGGVLGTMAGVAPAVALPVLMSVALGSVLAVLWQPVLAPWWAGKPLSGAQTAVLQTVAVAVLLHPWLSAAWLLLAGTGVSAAAAAGAELAFRASGRPKEADEPLGVDLFSVPPPAAQLPRAVSPASPEAP